MAKKKHGIFWWLFVSWWIWIFTLPIYLIKRAHDKKVDKEATEAIARAESDAALRAKYQKYTDRHYELLNDEKLEYAAALKTGDFSRVIALCKEDFAIAPVLVDYFLADFGKLPHYPAFELLAKIYEKQGNFEEACFVCQRAIVLGYTEDGTKGGMRGRLEKLLKRAGLNLTVDEYIAKINNNVKHS